MYTYFSLFNHYKLRLINDEWFLVDKMLKKVYKINNLLADLLVGIESKSIADFLLEHENPQLAKKIIEDINGKIGAVIEYDEKPDKFFFEKGQTIVKKLLLIDSVINQNIKIENLIEERFHSIEINFDRWVSDKVFFEILSALNKVSISSIILYLDYDVYKNFCIQNITLPKVIKIIYYNCSINISYKKVISLKKVINFSDGEFYDFMKLNFNLNGDVYKLDYENKRIITIK